VCKNVGLLSIAEDVALMQVWIIISCLLNRGVVRNLIEFVGMAAFEYADLTAANIEDSLTRRPDDIH
jgi:hypothetical protein